MSLALVAVILFSAMLVTSAFAEGTLLVEWLNDGLAITASSEIEASGEILLEDSKVPLVGKVAVVCNGAFGGMVGPGGEGSITKIFNLEGAEVGVALSGTALLCKTETGCESSASDIEVWPVGLPWSTQVSLVESGEYLILVEDFGYEIKCLIGGLSVEDKCEASDSDFDVINGTGGNAEIPATSVAEPLSSCVEGGAGAGVNEMKTAVVVKLSKGGPLTVSAEELEATLLAEWLNNGLAIVTSSATEASGEILLEDSKVPLVGKVAVVCSGILDGVASANGEGAITEVLNSSSELVGMGLSGTALLCKTETECESSASDIEVWPVGLPWATQLFLIETDEYLLLVSGSGYEIKCLIGGLSAEDRCEATNTDMPVVNGTSGVETPAYFTAEPLATCYEGGVGSGINETVTAMIPKLTEGGELTASSEETG